MTDSAEYLDVTQNDEAAESSSPHTDRDDSVDVQVIESLLSQVESCKHRGNVEFQKAKTFAKHTAGKNLLADACMQYAEGLKALAKVKSSLSQLQKRNEDREVLDAQSEHIIAIARLRSQADAIRPALFLNLAACNLLLGEWGPASACCSQVIDGYKDIIAEATTLKEGVGSKVESATQAAEQGGVNTSNEQADGWHRNINLAAKALYRRSTAFIETRDVSAARDDLLLAQRLKPTDAQIRRELKKVDKLIANEDAVAKLRRETEEGRRRKQQLRESSATGRSTPSESEDPSEKRIQESHESSRAASPQRFAANKDEEDSSGALEDMGSEEGARTGKSTQGKASEQSDGEEVSTLSEGTGEDEEPFPTSNGGHDRKGVYSWNQSIREVHVSVKVPKWARARNIRVTFRRLHLSVGVVLETTTATVIAQKDPAAITPPPYQEETSVLSGTLSRPIEASECVWSLEKPGHVLLYLQKELAADETHGSEWWSTVIEGEPEIDVSTCDGGSRLSEYPEHALRRGAKAFWDHQQKNPEQREAEELQQECLRQARQQMKEETAERQRDLERALTDPAKAELYRKLRETMPDVPITIK